MTSMIEELPRLIPFQNQIARWLCQISHRCSSPSPFQASRIQTEMSGGGPILATWACTKAAAI
jgi:hypothetical protein